MKLTCINVGYGDSFLLERKNSVILIDGGSALDAEFYGFPARIPAAEYLKKKRIGRIDTLIITHIHEDHVGGLAVLFEQADIGEVCVPYAPSLFIKRTIPDAPPGAPENIRLFAQALRTFTKILETCASKQIPVKEITSGMLLKYAGGLEIRVLGPRTEDKTAFVSVLQQCFSARSEELARSFFPRLDGLSNAASLLLKISCKDVHILLCADNCPALWDKAVFSQLENVTVLKLPHHGQRDCIDEDVIKRMPLRYVLTTASSDRRHNSANPEVYEILEKLYADRQNLTFLFSDAEEYPPYFFPKKSFQAIRMSFSEEKILVEFVNT